MTEYEDLLRRFQPQLLYDSQEAFFADDAAEMTDNPGNQLRRADSHEASGQVLARSSGTPRLELAFLDADRYGSGEPVDPADRLSIAGDDYRTQYVRLRVARPDLRNKMYGRGRRDSGSRLWLQYWFFYFYNDYHLAADFGLHEGDWEMVQLRLNMDGERPVPDLAVYAQHRTAEVRTWDKVRCADGHPDTPLVYPGRGSHASYFEPGLYDSEGWYDIADGRRKTPTLTLEVIDDGTPAWTLWPGLWGDTEPRVSGLEQPSPASPCATRQHPQWEDPKILLDGARTREPQTPGPPPEVSVSRAGRRLLVAYDFSRHQGDLPASLIITVNSEDDPGVPPKTFTFDVTGRPKGRIFPPLVKLDPKKRYDVNVSVSTANGVPSPATPEVLEPAGRQWRKTLLGEIGLLVGIIQQTLHRLLHRRDG